MLGPAVVLAVWSSWRRDVSAPQPVDTVPRDHVDQVHASVCNVKYDALAECGEVCLQLLQQLWMGVGIHHASPGNHARVPAATQLYEAVRGLYEAV